MREGPACWHLRRCAARMVAPSNDAIMDATVGIQNSAATGCGSANAVMVMPGSRLSVRSHASYRCHCPDGGSAGRLASRRMTDRRRWWRDLATARRILLVVRRRRPRSGHATEARATNNPPAIGKENERPLQDDLPSLNFCSPKSAGAWRLRGRPVDGSVASTNRSEYSRSSSSDQAPATQDTGRR